MEHSFCLQLVVPLVKCNSWMPCKVLALVEICGLCSFMFVTFEFGLNTQEEIISFHLPNTQ